MRIRGHDELNYADDPFVPVPLPEPVHAKEGTFQLGKAHLWYWDTGGGGEPLVMLHAAAGSGLLWGYQQPAFAQAGYRVIGYSRRGYHGSSPIDESDPGVAVDDLHDLADFLGLDRFHLLGVGAGGAIAGDYAATHAHRLSSLVICGNPGGQNAGPIVELQGRIRPQAWHALPAWARELSPGYCAANPAGQQKWIELNAISLVDSSHHEDLYRTQQKARNRVDAEALRKLSMPVMLMTGTADVYTPPAILRMVVPHIEKCEWLIAAEAGHSICWERPDLFNRVVLDFLGRQRR